MAPTIEIPQDIIDCIIDQLHDDPRALKTCAVVSRSFLRVSQKHLFSAIDLQYSRSPRFYHLLHTRPDIAPLIQEIAFSISDFDEDGDAVTGLSTHKILSMTHHLQRISLSGPEDPSLFMWEGLSGPVLSTPTLLNLWQSPALIDVRFSNIGLLPISLTKHLTHVRRLRLRHIGFYDDSIVQCSSASVTVNELDKLEDLELRFCTTTMAGFPLLKNLRLLSIGSPDVMTLLNARTIIFSSTSSIRTVMFYGVRRQSLAMVPLRMIRNLEFLLVSMNLRQGHDEEKFPDDLAALVQDLKDGASKTLKELTITVRVFGNDMLPHLSTCHGWTMLDDVLGNRSPALRRIHICVDSEAENIGTPDAGKQLDFLVSQRLPQLCERGVLSTTYGKITDIFTNSRPICCLPHISSVMACD